MDRCFDLLGWNAPWSALWGAPEPKPLEDARNAMQETGRMLTEIQLESLALLEHYQVFRQEGAMGVLRG